MKDYAPLNLLKPIGENIWIVDGDNIKFFGLPYPTRMTIIRLASGELFLHSPTVLTPELQREVAALGTVRHLVSPNWIHYAYLHMWAAAFPDTICWASPNVRKRATKMKSPVVFDRDLGEDAPDGWAGEIDQILVGGSRIHQEVVFFHRATKTLILTDLIENFETEKVPFWFRPIAWLAGILDPNGKMPRDMRQTFSKGHRQLRKAIETMIAWGPERIIISHGRWYQQDGISELERAFGWVLKK